MKGGTWLAVFYLASVGSAFAEPTRESSGQRFVIENARLTAESLAAPGQRFALSATAVQRRVAAETDANARFALKGGPLVPPGACGDVVFRDRFE